MQISSSNVRILYLVHTVICTNFRDVTEGKRGSSYFQKWTRNINPCFKQISNERWGNTHVEGQHEVVPKSSEYVGWLVIISKVSEVNFGSFQNICLLQVEPCLIWILKKFIFHNFFICFKSFLYQAENYQDNVKWPR